MAMVAFHVQLVHMKRLMSLFLSSNDQSMVAGLMSSMHTIFVHPNISIFFQIWRDVNFQQKRGESGQELNDHILEGLSHL